MQIKKTNKIEELILKLLAEKLEISLSDIAEVVGFNKANDRERKSISRAFRKLVDRGIIESKGNARARVYLLKEKIPTTISEFPIAGDVFNNIDLSVESKLLLNYLKKPVRNRTPAGYNQNFLRSYIPNKTLYLNTREIEELQAIGQTDSIVYPIGTYVKSIFNRLLIDLSWNSSRLEGNTYTLLETKRLIEVGESADGKNATETQMILNHKAAIEYMMESVEDNVISLHKICSIHALLSENLFGDPGASGRIRQLAVGISDTTYFPLDNPHILQECFDIFIEKLNLIKNPFEQSFFALVQLSYLQAFEDVNKRTARLLANIPLIKNNLKPLSFTDIEPQAYMKALLGIYEKNNLHLMKDLFIWAYKRSALRYTAIQSTLGEPNLLKLKYRTEIHNIIRKLIIEKVPGAELVSYIKKLINEQNIPDENKALLFHEIETEIASLHRGNIIQFRIQPNQFYEWQELQ